jgi:glycerol-3-phosphate dehydrogenase
MRAVVAAVARVGRRVRPGTATAISVGAGGAWLATYGERHPALAAAHTGPAVTTSGGVVPIPCEDGTSVIPWSTPPRGEQLRRLREEEFDLVVVGGGCVGAGVAWEAATRGLKVALVERGDFASGTSGRSTKLIHGGIRYLEAAVWGLDWEMFTLVQEALSERAHLMNAAPFMSRALPIIIPIYTWSVRGQGGGG